MKIYVVVCRKLYWTHFGPGSFGPDSHGPAWDASLGGGMPTCMLSVSTALFSDLQLSQVANMGRNDIHKATECATASPQCHRLGSGSWLGQLDQYHQPSRVAIILHYITNGHLYDNKVEGLYQADIFFLPSTRGCRNRIRRTWKAGTDMIGLVSPTSRVCEEVEQHEPREAR